MKRGKEITSKDGAVYVLKNNNRRMNNFNKICTGV